MFSLFITPKLENLESSIFRQELRNSKGSILLDVSSDDEYRELHIPGSINVDSTSPKFIQYLRNLNKGREYFIYCRNGLRSQQARDLMRELGFKRVFTLAAGIESWRGTLERSY